MFSHINVCIFWKCIQCTINLDKTQMSKKFPSNKINDRKIALFFFLFFANSNTALLLICDSYITAERGIVL